MISFFVGFYNELIDRLRSIFSFGGLSFADSHWLWLLLFLATFYFFKIIRDRKQKVERAVSAPSTIGFEAVARPVSLLINFGPLAHWVVMILLIFALARPQVTNSLASREASGIDIMLVIDTSGSMKARDYTIAGERPTRLEVIKVVIRDFIESRVDDRLGLVVFGTEAFTQAPLTLDHQVLKRFLSLVEIGMAGEATAIGDGLATAVLRLKDIQDPSRVVVLLTDGASNAGRVDPLAAAEAAKSLGIRVHTIGVGSKGDVPIIQDGQVVQIKGEIDEELLTKIAESTGGLFRKVSDTEALRAVYQEIDSLEKRLHNANESARRKELFHIPLLMALLLWTCEQLWRNSRWRPLP
jgi:Ca-activated chloride channel family protein